MAVKKSQLPRLSVKEQRLADAAEQFIDEYLEINFRQGSSLAIYFWMLESAIAGKLTGGIVSYLKRLYEANEWTVTVIPDGEFSRFIFA